MNVDLRALTICLSCLLAPISGAAQGFAGLGQSIDGFAVPERGTAIKFPRDHAAHPEYRIEWWYLTANLQDAAGNDYGVQWTLFRSATSPATRTGGRPSWSSPQIWLGHAGLTTERRHFHAERWSRGGIGTAGAQAAPFEAWIDEWVLSGNDDLTELRVAARGTDFAYDLQGRADGAIILHGDQGYSVKSTAGQASFYFSQPHIQVTGTLDLPEGSVDVAGVAWLDREWSSQPLAADQRGWDWFSLHLNSGDKMMGFRLRGDRDYTAATWIDGDGVATNLADGALSITPLKTTNVAGRNIPTEWALSLPERGVEVTVQAVNAAAFMDTSFPYWEGPVRVDGSHSGRGYLEMTGYE